MDAPVLRRVILIPHEVADICVGEAAEHIRGQTREPREVGDKGQWCIVIKTCVEVSIIGGLELWKCIGTGPFMEFFETLRDLAIGIEATG